MSNNPKSIKLEVNKLVESKVFLVIPLRQFVPYLSECEYENKILITLHRRENHDKKRVVQHTKCYASNHPDHDGYCQSILIEC